MLFGHSVRFIKERNLWMTPSVVRLVFENVSVEKYQLLLLLSFYLGCSPPKELSPWTISSHAAKYYHCGEVIIICGVVDAQLLLYSEVLYQCFLFPLHLLWALWRNYRESCGNIYLWKFRPGVPNLNVFRAKYTHSIQRWQKPQIPCGVTGPGTLPFVACSWQGAPPPFLLHSLTPSNWIPANVFSPHK